MKGMANQRLFYSGAMASFCLNQMYNIQLHVQQLEIELVAYFSLAGAVCIFNEVILDWTEDSMSKKKHHGSHVCYGELPNTGYSLEFISQ